MEQRLNPAAVRTASAMLLLALLAGAPAAASGSEEEPEGTPPAEEHGGRTSRISDEAVPVIDIEAVPERPRPIVDLGNDYLGSGTLRPGFRLPGGAVWQPSFLVYGTFRSALQSFDGGTGEVREWANRLDLLGNLQLSGTERLLVGFRPFDDEGVFTGYNFEGGVDGSTNGFNADISTLFFEGDLGEIFPGIDKNDTRSFDLGFSIGRQPLGFQDGMLINDDIDAFGITRNTLLPRGGTDFQLTYILGWSNVHRDDNLEDPDAKLTGFFFTADYPVSTINADFVYVFDTEDGNDGAYWGISSVQRLGYVNTTFRVLGSYALQDETAAVSDGYLLFGELSWTPAWTHNNMYVNAFWGIDRFASAARGPATGGPLGRVGILFAAVGLGNYGAPLGNRPDDSAGFAFGYQIFSHDTRRQAIFEVGGRKSTNGLDDGAAAIGIGFQQAIGQRFVLRLDAFGSANQTLDDGVGGRVEWVVQF